MRPLGIEVNYYFLPMSSSITHNNVGPTCTCMSVANQRRQSTCDPLMDSIVLFL